ncbi:hypothetical protein C6Y11_03585 [Lactiplantibacillus pentosus]|uniref:DUF1642 domain-containing protein n=1 Tax=Lactiplantibacillus pentosus TaxID=1589 RepID=A0AB37RGZ6_LACPE|nr:DUF1642 domain-containing protein [Lactiplantibacillus pentosus]MCT3304354.1 DUF1642 domain-containing protein [Lactiplantibacillus pentosus]PRO81082.1 hypothetical protein C6Y09_07720 [Lactiplantibacillus pentosus]PRO81265.1 hypothetical protein C6Y11_03585 [Lactiplantibacillus pentosus]PRO92310.1 hypothetical protein C6Y12_05710 [Lactiplantibacillus pentosus]RMW43690.1 DUF1642 domain-containing protein [Lactiplantibacillus pentosus]
MIKAYRKTATIKAEKFDPENGVIPKGVFDKEYEHTTSGMISAMVDELKTSNQSHNWHVKTLEGDLKVKPGYWIVTGVNGERWPIADDVFKNTYAELPVINKGIAHWIELTKQDGKSLGDMFVDYAPKQLTDADEHMISNWVNDTKNKIVISNTLARAWLDGYTVEEEK